MISITCTHCQAELTIDDAFAGGVCRCQYCGTIQTVPSHLKQAGAAPSATSKTLYQKKVRAGAVSTGQSSGLDELAQAVGGSGIPSSGLGSGRLTAPQSVPAHSSATVQAEAERDQRKPLPLLPIAVGGGLLILLVLGLAIFFLTRSHPLAQASGPTFCDVTIDAPSIVYLLDNGNSSDNLFDPLKAACYKSLATLGSDRKFQVALWDNGVNAVAYPQDGLRSATPQEIAACKQALADTVATGNSHLAGPLKRAVTLHPVAIVIATGKWDLDRDDRQALADAQSAGVHLYTFGLGTAPESGDLKLAASATGGTFKHLSTADLNRASD